MGGIANPKEFKEYVKDIIIRYEQKEVMPELPDLIRSAFYCEMDDVTSRRYSNEVNDFVAFWNKAVIGGEEDTFETQQNMLARINRMRHLIGLAKIPNTLEHVKDFLEQTEGKIVVFVHHKDVGQIIFDQIHQHCLDEGLPLPLKLTGGMSSEDRYQIQEKFNNTSSRVLVASTLASGEGLNLQSCHYCILHERQWNPANEEQTEKRFHRIGQHDVVKAIYMLGQDTIDSLFHTIVERKRQQFHAAMNKGEAVGWTDTGLIKELAQAIVNTARGRRVA